MPLITERVAFGRPALDRLRAALAAARGGDALAPATVVVPSNLAGITARRALAPIAAVRFATVYELADLVGSGLLSRHGLSPVTDAAIRAAVRVALATDAGEFAEVAHHAATERAIAQAHSDLTSLTATQLDRLASLSARSASLVRIHLGVRELLSGFYHEVDLMSAAAREVESRSAAARELGEVVVHLRAPPRPGVDRLLEALARRSDVLVTEGQAHRVPPQTILSAPDPDEEVRSVLRQLLARAEGKKATPLHRMAIAYPPGDLYPPILHDHLCGAGVPFNGPAARTLGQSVAGRALLGLLALGEHDFRRDDVFALLASAPILDAAGRPVQTARWEVLSRQAGITAGASTWRERLEASGFADAGLGQFIEDLAADLHAGATTWEGLAAWAVGLLRRYLGTPRPSEEWPRAELDAAHRVEAVLGALGSLDAIDPAPSPAAFRHALTEELSVPDSRVGSFGEGVLLVPVTDVAGLDLDLIAVVGACEGLLPSAGGGDSLIPEREREALGGALPGRAERRAQEEGAFRAALCCAPESILSWPRGDLLKGRDRSPSRWLMEAARWAKPGLASRDDLAQLGGGYLHVESLAHGLRAAPVPGSLTDHDMMSLAAHILRGEPPGTHPLAGPGGELHSGFTLIGARSEGGFTAWSGDLSGLQVPSPAAAPTSPTALEHWAACPFRYFMASVLRVSDFERPEEVRRPSPADVGTIVHRVLQLFISEVIESPPGERPEPGDPWGEHHRRRLAEIATRELDRFEEQGATGLPLLWRRTRERVLAELEAWVDRDTALRSNPPGGEAPAGSEVSYPVQAELGFGGRSDGTEPLVVELPGGRRLHFRGRIDRVDCVGGAGGAGGGDRGCDRLLVIDYKTGKPNRFSKIAEDPVLGGTVLQLAVYAEAARALVADRPVHATYWFISTDDNFVMHGFDMTPERRQRALEVLAAIAEGIEAGVFPANPGESVFYPTSGFSNCLYCPYDRACPSDRDRIWARALEDPRVEVYRRMTGQEPPAGGSGEL